MLIRKRSQVVDIVIDNNVEIIRLIVRRNIRLGKGLRHLVYSVFYTVLYKANVLLAKREGYEEE